MLGIENNNEIITGQSADEIYKEYKKCLKAKSNNIKDMLNNVKSM